MARRTPGQAGTDSRRPVSWQSRYQSLRPVKGVAIPNGWTKDISAAGRDGNITALLESLARKPKYDGNENEWDRLLELLNLKLNFQPAVARIIAQNRWRNVRDPKAYVARAAYRSGFGMGLPDFTERAYKRIASSRINDAREQGFDSAVREDGGDEARLENLAHQQAIKHGGYTPDDFDEIQIPQWLQRENECDGVNWGTVAKCAALKTHMAPSLALTLNLRFREHLSRDEAMRRVATHDEQQRVAADWKWIDRNFKIRIAPLFRMECAPTVMADVNRASRPRPTIRPWEAIRQACARERHEAGWISTPSFEQEEKTLHRVTMPVPGTQIWRRDRDVINKNIPYRNDASESI